MMTLKFQSKKMIKIIEGDITKLNVDIIVNAANETLFHGGGVARAIANAAGKELIKESNNIIKKKSRLNVGEAVYTTAGNLNAKYVIHVVGPRGTKQEKLELAMNNIFELGKKLKAKSIAIPAVSCGIFGFDKKQGTKIIYDISKKYEKDMDISLVSIDKEIIDYWKELSSILSPT